jgi:integrase
VAWTRKLPSGRIQACYRDPSGRTRMAGSLGRKGAAERAWEEQETRMRGGEWLDPELARATVGGLADKWLEGARHTLKPKTVASDRSMLSTRVLPALGSAELRALKPSDVTEWVGEDGCRGTKPVAHPADSRRIAARARHPSRRRLPRAQPGRANKAPKARAPRGRVFRAAGSRRNRGRGRGALRRSRGGMGVCGLLWGDAVALRGRHVDQLRRRLLVEESLAEISGRLVFGNTKSHACRRVPVPATLLARLPVAPPDELLFRGPQGGALRYRNFLARVWHPTLQRLEIPRVRVHILRHSAAARIGGAGGSPKTLQTILGHRSAAFSLTVYGHLFEADLDALAKRLDERRAQ